MTKLICSGGKACHRAGNCLDPASKGNIIWSVGNGRCLEECLPYSQQVTSQNHIGPPNLTKMLNDSLVNRPNRPPFFFPLKTDTHIAFLKYSCIYLFLAVLGLHRCPGFSSCGEWGSPCSGFSCCRPWALGHRLQQLQPVGTVVAAPRL